MEKAALFQPSRLFDRFGPAEQLRLLNQPTLFDRSSLLLLALDVFLDEVLDYQASESNEQERDGTVN